METESSLERFLEESSSLESCPAYLDPTMLEHMIDMMGSNSENLNTALRWGFKHKETPAKFVRTLCLKLIRKCLESSIAFVDYRDRITEILTDSLHYATLEDFSLLSSIFLLLNTVKAENINDDLKKDAGDLALRCLKDVEVSLFVKKAACNYCIMLINQNKNSLDLKSLVSSLCNSDDDFKCTAEIFLCFPDFIDSEVAKDLCSSAITKRTFNYAYIKLLAKLFEKYPELRLIFTDKNWISERMRLSILRNMVSNGCNDVIPLVLSDKKVTLADIVPCLTYLSRQERESLMKQWVQKLNDRRKCAAEDVLLLLQLPWLSEADYDSIFVALKERIWNAPEFLHTMAQKNADWCRKRESDIIKFTLEGIESQDWEKRDAAVEIARIVWQVLHSNVDIIVRKLEPLCYEDPNPFVKANVLRFLDEVNAKNVVETAKKVYWTEVFSEPRLEAISVLDRNITPSEQWCIEVLKAAINDPDIEIQEKALSIGSQLIKFGGQHADAVRSCLEKRLKDGSMWRNEINAILGNDLVSDSGKQIEGADDSMDLLKEALAKLRFPPDMDSEQQMTMDCY